MLFVEHTTNMNTSTFSRHPSIDLIIGPMYASKSLELIRRLSVFAHMGLRTLYVNHVIDIRSNEDFSSHSNIAALPIGVESLKCASLSEIPVSRFDVIGIDEAQFFTGLYDFCTTTVDTHGIKLVVAGLSGDSNQRPFGEILDLIPECDELTKLYAYCTKCIKNNRVTPAIFTVRLVECDEDFYVGGENDYASVCRLCKNEYQKMIKRRKTGQ